MSLPFVNDLLTVDGRRARLLHTETDLNRAWLIDLDDHTAQPYWKRCDELFQSPGVSAPAPEKEQKAAARLEPRPSMKKKADQAWHRISPLVGNVELFDSTLRTRLLEKRVAELKAEGVSACVRTLRRDFRSFWQGGQTRAALYGHYDKCGGKEGTNGRGRKAKDYKVRQLTKDDEKHMRSVLTKHYLTESQNTLSSAHSTMHREHYSFEDGNGVLTLRPDGEVPSLRQLRHFLHKNFSMEVILRKRKGNKNFERNHRAKTGSVELDCHGVGHIYELDASILDVTLVSTKSRQLIVGKPTLYLIIDRKSRLIVGFYLGFENASEAAARESILSLGMDMRKFCAALGIRYDPADWPANGLLPKSILIDMGEFKSKHSRQLSRSAHTTISTVPGLRPDWKPLVECRFKLTHQVIAPDTPGYQPDVEQKERRARDITSEVSLDLNDCLKVIVEAIIAQNRQVQMSYKLSADQIARGVMPIARELFVDGIKHGTGQLARVDFDALRLDLLPRGSAVITEHGIEFNKCFYTCPEAEKYGWFSTARNKGRMDVEVAFDYRLVDSIVVFARDKSGACYTATLTRASAQRFEGCSFAEVKLMLAMEDELKRQGKAINRQNMFEYSQATAPTIAHAVAETEKLVKGMSRSSRKADTKHARMDDRKSERQATVVVGDEAVPQQPPPPSATSLPKENVVPIGATHPATNPPSSEKPAAPTKPNAFAAQRKLALQQRQQLKHS